VTGGCSPANEGNSDAGLLDVRLRRRCAELREAWRGGFRE